MESNSSSSAAACYSYYFRPGVGFIWEDLRMVPGFQGVFNVVGFGNGDNVNATPGSFDKSLLGSYTGTLRFVFKPASGYPPGWYQQVIGSMYYWMGDPQHAVPYTDVRDPQNGALDDLYESIKTNTTSVGEALGESGKTAAGLRNFTSPLRSFAENSNRIGRHANDILKHTSRLKRSLGAAKLAGKEAASLWLQWVYAVRPLCKDIRTLLGNQEDLLNARYTSNGRKTQRIVSEVEGTVPNSKVRTRTHTSRRCHYQVTYFITNPLLFDLDKAGLLNIPALAWELGRLTLVVDWMFNVGQYLSLLGSAVGAGLTFQRGFCTSGYRQDTTSTFFGQDDQVGWVTEGYGVGRRTNIHKTRAVLDSFPMPRIPQPTFPFKNGSERLINASAMLASLIH